MELNTFNHRNYFCYVYGDTCHKDGKCSIDHRPPPPSDCSSSSEDDISSESDWSKSEHVPTPISHNPPVQNQINQNETDHDQSRHNCINTYIIAYIHYLLCKKPKNEYLKEDTLQEEINISSSNTSILYDQNYQFLKCSFVTKKKTKNNDTDVKVKNILLMPVKSDAQQTNKEIHVKKNERFKLYRQKKISTDEFNGYVQSDPSPCKSHYPNRYSSEKARCKNIHSLKNKSHAKEAAESESYLKNANIYTDPPASTSSNNFTPNDLTNKFNFLKQLKESLNGDHSVMIPCTLVFNRELPSYGHKQWQAHFGRTFDIYSKLWKFQQQHRSTLDTRYGLKRWQIGEIASKIGQLYYHFYLRTSDTTYLVEAFSFYSAIRGRRYYTLASKEAKCELMVKKLRYYARFIVVAILLQQPITIDELLAELDQQIIAYGNAYDPNDQIEWINVLEEVRAFLIAEPGITIIDSDNKNRVVTISGRLNQSTIPTIERNAQMSLVLHDAMIIGSGTQLVKFSELTIDMFRMVQNLEWEIEVPIRDPSGDSPQNRSGLGEASKSATSRPGGVENDSRSLNPHKYLLFKPSARQVLIYLASSCNDLPPNCALLIYISADGHHPQQNTHPEDYSYDIGGLITTSKSDIYRDYNRETKTNISKYKDKHILYPGDLHPFTRRPLFIIVDSDNSYAFQHIPKIFGQPLVVLMSPLSLPVSLSDRRNQGNLFTLFLHNPIAGLCNACDVFTVSISIWESCVHLRDRFMIEATRLLMRIRLDPMYYPFLGDEFLRLMILRYVFCESVLRMHRSFRARTNLPRAYPPLPDDLFEHRDLVAIVMQMADYIGIRSHFHDASAPGPPPRD